jgi:hypothetical protein
MPEQVLSGHFVSLVWYGSTKSGFCRPFVEYKGTIPAPDIEKLRAALEAEANSLVSAGGQVYFFIFPPNFFNIDYVILSKFLYF